MKKLIAGVVLGVGLTAMAHGAGDPQAGEQNAAVCAGCHGQNGAKPIMGSYPKLSGLGEKYLYRQLVLIKDKERNIAEMTGILDNMNDQDLQDLAAYFNAQDMVVGQADPDLVDQGAALYRGGNMANGRTGLCRLSQPARCWQRAGRLPGSRWSERRVSDQAAECLSRWFPGCRHERIDHDGCRLEADRCRDRSGFQLHLRPELKSPDCTENPAWCGVFCWCARHGA